MVIGFTGTRKGMSKAQKRQFSFVMAWLSGAESFVHGAAVGADTEAATFVMKEPELRGLEVVAMPAGENPLARNRQIVAMADVLIAAPDKDHEELRSGTWATVRYARQAGKPIVMLSRGETA